MHLGLGLTCKLERCLGMPSGMVSVWLYNLRMIYIRSKSLWSPWQKRKIRRIVVQGPVNLHLGCGGIIIPNWLNVDADSNNGVDFVWDITAKLPLPEASCKYIYSHHVLEHLTRQHALDLLRECHRCLVVGGVLRTAVPDLQSEVRLYIQGHCGSVTPTEALNSIFYDHRHQFLYDFDQLRIELLAAGFKEVVKSDFNASKYDALKIDKGGGVESVTLYVEARKCDSIQKNISG